MEIKKISKKILINSRMNNIFCMAVISLLGFFSILWFRGDNLLCFGDFYFLTNRSQYLVDIFYSWVGFSSGMEQFRSIANVLPFGIFLFATEKLSLSLVTSEKIWIFSQFVSMGLSMYFLISVLLGNKSKTSNMKAMVGAIIFMFNPWLAVNIPFLSPYIVYGPLILGMYIKALQEEKGLKFAIIFSITWSVTSASSLINLRAFLIQSILLVAYFIFFAITEKEKRKKAIIFSFYSLAIFFFLNFYIMLTLIFYSFEIVSKTADVYGTINFLWSDAFSLNSIEMTNVWRLIGNWSFYESYKEVPYYYFSNLYASGIFIAVSYILSFSILFSFLSFKKNSGTSRKYLVFSAILFVFGTFLMIGINNNFSAFLSNHFKFYSMLFSIPYLYGGFFLIIGYCILFSFGFFKILDATKKKASKYLFFLVIVLSMAAYSFPVYLGSFVYPGNEIIGSARFKIPEYYFDIKNSIGNKNLDFKIFSLPYSKLGYFDGKWDSTGFMGIDFFEELVKKPILSGVGIGENIADISTSENNYESFKKSLLLINARYLFIREDANLMFMKDNPWYIVPSESSWQNLKKLGNMANFGNIISQKIENSEFISHFYTSKNIIFSERESDDLFRILNYKDYDIKSIIFFEKQNIGKKNTLNRLKKLDENSEVLPMLEFKKINPIKYRIRMHGASGEFPLVFSESFHDGWKAYLASPENFKLQMSNVKSNSNDKISNYKVLDGNEDDQADKNELMEYIDNGWITALGDGKEKTTKHYKWENMRQKPDYTEKYNIDFISKNFQGTVQNDNLPNGSIFETWFKKPMDDGSHLMANGYANSWVIDSDEICAQEGSCIKNPDGTYDFEIIVEFWPQRLFYIGIFISGMTFFGCVGYLAYDWKKNRKENGLAKKENSDIVSL